jgi:hypothetical protein
MSLWRPWSLAALVDATSRVSDNYRVKRFSENIPVTMPERLNDTEREKTDGEAVLRHAFHGEPLDPEVARRVRERGAEITEEIYREHGEGLPGRVRGLYVVSAVGANRRLNLSGAAILVFRGSTSLQAAPAA